MQSNISKEFVKWAKAVDASPTWFYYVNRNAHTRRLAKKALDPDVMPTSEPVKARILFLLLLAAGARA